MSCPVQEMMTKANFKIKMVTDSQDLETLMKAAFDKQRDIQKVADEALSVAEQGHSKVTEIEAQHRTSSEQLAQLQTSYDGVMASRVTMSREKSAVIEKLSPIHDELKRRLADLGEKEERLQWEIQTINSELTDIASSDGLMVKSKKKMQEALLGLE